jgi:hypothetical protein
MALDPIPASFQSDGLWTITYVPTGSNPLSAAILNGATSKDVTYSFTPDGFTYSVTQADVPDPRLTLVQSLTRPGKTSETLSIKYVDSTDATSLAVLFTPALNGYLVIRRAVANGTAYAAGQIVDVLTFTLGVQAPDAPTENGIDTITQGVYLTSATQRKVPVVA